MPGALMDDKQVRITDAAIRVICRYGVKRTTMQDIADEAGIVRQTLYNVYKNKDEVLRATITCFAEKARASVREDWANSESLGDKLDIVFHHTIVHPYELTHASPEADDIVSGFNAAARDEIAKESERDRQLIEEALQPYQAALRQVGLSLFQGSDFIQRAAFGFKKSATSLAHLQELLASLKAIVLRLVSPPAGSG